MNGATLFSGIGAPECAAPFIDWRWSADIDDFANAVRAHHWPDVPNLGDVSNLTGDDIEPVDVLVFGSPCQSFSVAGKRLGMDDPRGNLALVALALVQRIRPRWFVFENVPGLFSSSEGDDFAAFLRAVRECGYSGAWRVLDAQYFGVPQRRRRIFFVGHLGDDWRPSAAVLFEPESLSGNPAPGREQGKGVAALTSNGVGTCGADDNQAQAGHLIHHVETDVVGALSDGAHMGGGLNGQDVYTGRLIAFNARQNPDAWEDRTGPIDTDGGTQAVAMNLRGRDGGAMPETDYLASLRAADGGSSRSYVAVTGDVTHALNTANNGKHSGEDGTGRHPSLVLPMVRRLTPVECERLQGFPDGWTDIPWRGKRAPDGRRYKALGNSMAVPVMRWILERLAAQDAMMFETLAAE